MLSSTEKLGAFMISSQADLALYDRNGQLIAVVEIKNKQGTSREWAMKLRRNLHTHEGYPQAEFFLLATPDRLYLWRNVGTGPSLIPPTYEIDAQPIFAPYFERTGASPTDISGNAFELIVTSWLEELARSHEPTGTYAVKQPQLAESGFLTTVRDSRIAYEEAA